MGLFDWFKKKEMTPEQIERNKPILRSLFSYFGINTSIIANQNISYLIEYGYKQNSHVYSVVNWISEQAANIPLVVQQQRGEEWVAVDSSHPLQMLINKPNPYQSGLEQRQQFYTNYLVTGNALRYAARIKEGRDTGQALETWIPPTQNTEIVGGGWMKPIDGYRVNLTGGERYKLPYEDVMHMRTTSLDYENGQQFWGQSPLLAGLWSLKRSNSNYKAAATSYENLGAMGILAEKGDGLSPAYSDELQKEKDAEWIEEYNGPENKGKVKHIGRPLEFIRLNISPADLELLKDNEATKRDFCSIYKVDSKIFNDTESTTYNNVLEAKKSAYNDAVIPLVEREIKEYTDWLVPSYGDDLRIIADTSDIQVLQADREKQMRVAVDGVKNSILTPNEGRDYVGLAPDPDPIADQLLTKFNTMPLSDTTMMTDDAEKALNAMGIKHYLNGK